MTDNVKSGLDICECGDYRKSHEGGKGRCYFYTHGIPDWKFDRCRRFKLAESRWDKLPRPRKNRLLSKLGIAKKRRSAR